MVQHLILFKLDQNGSQSSFGAFSSKVLASSQFRCFSSKFRSELSDQELIRVKCNLLSIKIKTFTQKCQGKTVQVNLLKIDFHSKLQSVIMLSVSQTKLNSQCPTKENMQCLLDSLVKCYLSNPCRTYDMLHITIFKIHLILASSKRTVSSVILQQYVVFVSKSNHTFQSVEPQWRTLSSISGSTFSEL